MRALTLKNFDWVFSSETLSAMDAELRKVLKTRHGLERVESFMGTLQDHLNPAAEAYFACKIEDMPYGSRQVVEAHYIRVFAYYVMDFIDDKHREHIVRCHAQNMSTTHAVYDLIETYPEISRLAEGDALGEDDLTSLLVHRLAYLKPTANKWPAQKYGGVWDTARQAYRAAQRTMDLPYTSVEEQIRVLSREAERIIERLETGPYVEKEHQTLMDTLHKIFDRLDTTDRLPRAFTTQLASEPQLIGVLERLTLALTSTEHVSGQVKLGEVIEKFQELVPPASTDNSIQMERQSTLAKEVNKDE